MDEEIIKRWTILGKWTATGILIMGVIHNIATFTPLIQESLVSLSPDTANVFISFSLATGTSLIFCGILLISLLNKLKRYPFMITPVLITGSFLLIFGILSFCYIPNNPFTWIVATLCIVMFGVTLRLRSKL